MVEIFFGIIIQQAVRRGAFRSGKELTTATGVFTGAYDDRCQPSPGQPGDILEARRTNMGGRSAKSRHRCR